MDSSVVSLLGTVMMVPSPARVAVVPSGVVVSVGRAVASGRGWSALDVLEARRHRLVPQHRPEAQLRGLADQLEGPVGVVDARDLHEDVVALDRDLGLGDDRRCSTRAGDDVLGLFESVLVDVADGLEHDRHTALQVEAEQRGDPEAAVLDDHQA